MYPFDTLRHLTLLVAKKLEQYADAMAEHGHSFVDDLLEADGEELARLTKDVQMKPPEARRFREAVAAASMERRQHAGDDIVSDGLPNCLDPMAASLCHRSCAEGAGGRAVSQLRYHGAVEQS